MRYFLATFTAIIACFLLTSCTTLADARLAKGTGKKETYDSPYNETWQAVVCSVTGRGLSIVDENKPKGYILAQRGITAFSYGENVAVFVRKRGKDKTEVEVVSKKAMETNIFAPDWTDDILSGVDGCLN